jgi:transposase
MGYAASAWERAMTVQEVVLKALSGEIHWFRAADILGMSARTLRRWRERYEQHGYVGLVDKRRQSPSVRRIAAPVVERLLRLYRERYRGFNVRHFHQIARREHGVIVSYSFLKQALQAAGLVKRHRARGRHRQRREPRACFGELLHLDGSPHAWLARVPELRLTLIAVVDDATKRLLYAQLEVAESTQTVMQALRTVFTTWGLPMALYTDRASWAFVTRKAHQPVDKTRVTQVGRALARLGVEHIPAYSAQARGRSERVNRTLQDRLVNELRVAGITTLEAANGYLRDVFIPQYNEAFSCPPRDPEPAWVAVGAVDLEQILCHEEGRVVGQDNVVAFDPVALQVAKQPGRRTCAGLTVTVRRHLNGHYAVWRGTQCLGRFDATGQPVDAAASVDGRRSRPPTSRLDRRARRPAVPQRPPALTATL